MRRCRFLRVHGSPTRAGRVSGFIGLPMRTIPITPGKLTGDVLEACHRRYLDGADLSAWADALLTAGFDSDAVIEAVANPDMHWEKVPALFSRMCRELRLSEDVAKE